jgi:hypothetical protein
MKRREVIALLGGAASAWPLLARGQPTNKTPKVGVLWHAGALTSSRLAARPLVLMPRFGSTYTVMDQNQRSSGSVWRFGEIATPIGSCLAELERCRNGPALSPGVLCRSRRASP